MTVRCIFVVNSSAKWFDENGSSRLISNSADFNFLRSSRAWADLIVTSGKTVRANKYSPVKKPLWIITNSSTGEFSELVSAGALLKADNAKTVLAEAKLNYSNILLEFGPLLITQAINDRLIDELDLSVTGQVGTYSLETMLPELPFSLESLRHESILIDENLEVFRFYLAK